MRYEEVAHIKKSATGDHYLFQSNEEHLEGVAKLAEQFASEFGMGSWGYVLGLLHDKGKERKSFQDYIRQNSGFAPEIHSSYFKKGSIMGQQSLPMWERGLKLMCKRRKTPIPCRSPCGSVG